MVKLVCCDVDNTLLFDKNGTICTEITEVVDKLSARGVLFAVVSGRPLCDLLRLFGNLSDKIIMVAFDGALALYKGRILFERPIDKNIYMAFIDTVEKQNRGLCAGESIIYTLEDAFVPTPDGVAAKSLTESVTMNGHIKIAGNPDFINKPVYKLSMLTEGENTDFDFIVREWSQYMNNIYSGGKWCEFVSAGTDKGLAVNLIMEQFGIMRSEAMAFGDGINDISMLRACEFSYACSCADEDVKAAAAYTTSNVPRSITAFFKI